MSKHKKLPKKVVADTWSRFTDLQQRCSQHGLRLAIDPMNKNHWCFNRATTNNRLLEYYITSNTIVYPYGKEAYAEEVDGADMAFEKALEELNLQEACEYFDHKGKLRSAPGLVLLPHKFLEPLREFIDPQ